MRILHPDSPVDEVVTQGGSKAAGLHRLGQLGLRVPEWRAIPVDAFEQHLRGNDLADAVSSILADIRLGTVEQCAQLLDEVVRQAATDPALLQAVADIDRDLGGGSLAVRSSGTEEDGTRTSFAGLFTTLLNVTGADALVDAVLTCWSSTFSARSLSYRLQHRLGPRAGGMAVVVQKLVPAEVSGVLFTTNPLTGSGDERLISATLGLGEGLVSGAVDADTIVCRFGTVVSTTIGDKSERFESVAGGGVTAVAVEPDVAARGCVGPELLAQLCAAADAIEAGFGGPQDVEWAWSDDDALWLLQSRPVTSSVPLSAPERATAGQIRTWDNSNIIESFRGVTSPLTYTFARRVYGAVYRWYARTLGLPERAVDEVDEWAPHLLGYFHGHVYYNLHNWYRLVRLAPFYRNGRKSLELTLGVRESLPDDIAESLVPYTPEPGIRGWLATARTRTVFAWRILRREALVRRFLADFQSGFSRYDGVDYESLSGDEVLARYLRLEGEFVRLWGRVSITDPVINLFFGLLSSLTRRWLPDAPQWLSWAAAGPGRVVSVEPAEQMARLADLARADPTLARLIRHAPPEASREALAAAGYDRFLAEVDHYIDRFGYRSLDELKLEVPELAHDPASFFALLRSAMGDSGSDGRTSTDVEPYLREHLSPWRRVVFGWVRRRAQRAFGAREQTRFCRTRAFGVVKRMFRALGADLTRAGQLASPDEIYLLSVDEVIGAYEGTLVDTSLRDLVARRRAAATETGAVTREPERFTTVGAAYAQADLSAAAGNDPADLVPGSGEMVGIGAGPGRATGPAAVVDLPHGIDGDVVVTYRTDPGWVAVLPSASALLIERGSPLTHVAIVARELGVPTVVQIRDLTRRVRTGMTLDVDGSTGRVRVVAGDSHD